MDCNCNTPNCIECFIRYAESVGKMGCADKELYYEWLELLKQNDIDKAWDDCIPDDLGNPNEW